MALPQFLNVDLELRDAAGVGALVRALVPKLVVLHEEMAFVSLELASGPTPPLDVVLNQIVDVVEGLPAMARRHWARCQQRRLNVGIEAGDGNPSSGFVVPAATLKRLVAVGADLELTVYPPSPGRKRTATRAGRGPRRSRR